MTYALQAKIEEKRFPAVGSAPSKHVVQKFELDVPENGFVALFGPSGCGKTTILNILAGIDSDFVGEIRRRDEDRIAYVFQEPRLLPWLTVEDNLRLVLDDAVDAEPLIDLWLDEMGLRDVRKVFANRLSLGMARRVALARAFVIHPKLLLMDEPFVSLDEPTALRLQHLLLETLSAHPAAVVFVTHSLREAITLADRIVFLSRSPTSVLRIAAVPLDREQRRDEQAIEAARQELITDE
ncbi:MAG: ABC transporter ATP-binding protein [Rhizobiales bacterium]|nr:ABC transporter ATP-binding protein [Hyphomicrobiales bacterium]